MTRTPDTTKPRCRARAWHWLWRIVRPLLRTRLWLQSRAEIAEMYREWAEAKAAHELSKYFDACEWASSERARNETLRRLLARQHEAATLALPGYASSDLAAETADALGKPNTQSTGGSAPCPDCYGGHFRPCNVCGDTGWVEYVQPSPEQVRKDLVAAGVDPEEAWRAFQRDVLKVTPNTKLTGDGAQPRRSV